MDLKRRRETVAKAWHDFFVAGKEEVDGIEPYLLDSWKRTKEYGVDIFHDSVLASDLEKKKLSIERHGGLIDVARPNMADLFKLIKESGFMITLTDEEGYILDTYISSNIEENAKFQVHTLSEKRVGTNAMGTCLYLNQPVQTWAEENCYVYFHEFTTSAAPIHDQNGNLIGCIGITGYADTLSPHTLGMAKATAMAIENQLRHTAVQASATYFENYTRLVSRTVSDGIISIDADGRISSLNKTAEKLFKIMEEEAFQKSFFEIVSGPGSLISAIKQRENFYDREFVLHIGSHTRKCRVSVTSLDNAGKHMGQIIVLRDAEPESKAYFRALSEKRLFRFEDVIGDSDVMKDAIQLAEIAARGNSNILIIGESGTGKELFAQSIHSSRQKKDKPFIAVNCGAIPESLVESELFGYEGGAFTGSKREGQPGKFELANGGTLFLDEIGEMPMSIQASLLRVIQERKVTRVGAASGRDVDVMIIAATNKNLFEAVKNATFRGDLFYRLNVFTINIPPLREHKEDLEKLIPHFLEKFNRRFHTEITKVCPEAMELLYRYDWPGNVRELENVLERAVQISRDGEIAVRDLPVHLQYPAARAESILTQPRGGYLEQREAELIQSVLASTKGNVRAAAERLGIGRATLYRKLQQFNLDIQRYRTQHDEK